MDLRLRGAVRYAPVAMDGKVRLPLFTSTIIKEIM
jgi:hypothetical protein